MQGLRVSYGKRGASGAAIPQQPRGWRIPVGRGGGEGDDAGGTYPFDEDEMRQGRGRWEKMFISLASSLRIGEADRPAYGETPV